MRGHKCYRKFTGLRSVVRYPSTPSLEAIHLNELDVTWRSALLLMLVAPAALVALKLFWHPVERTACRWLAVFLLAFCLDTVPQIIGFAGAYSVWPWLTFAPFNFQPFFGPLVFLHAHALMRKTPPGKL